MYLQKVPDITEKLSFLLESWRSMTKIADPDPLVRGMDPWLRIWIHTKMLWIRNTSRSKNESDSMRVLERRPSPSVVFEWLRLVEYLQMQYPRSWSWQYLAQGQRLRYALSSFHAKIMPCPRPLFQLGMSSILWYRCLKFRLNNKVALKRRGGGALRAKHEQFMRFVNPY